MHLLKCPKSTEVRVFPVFLLSSSRSLVTHRIWRQSGVGLVSFRPSKFLYCLLHTSVHPITTYLFHVRFPLRDLRPQAANPHSPFVTPDLVPPNVLESKPISFMQAIQETPTFGRSRVVKCGCKSGCKTNACACFKAGVECNSNCHPKASCCNRARVVG